MAVIYVFANDGSCLEKRGGPLTPGLESAYHKKFGQDIYLTEWPEDPHPDLHDMEELSAEIVEGAVRDIIYTESGNFIHAFLTLAAGEFGPAGVPWIAADGVDAVTATIKMTSTDDSEAAALPIGTTESPQRWLIPVRRVSDGDPENLPISMIDGQATATYDTTESTDREIRQDDFDPIEIGGIEYEVKLRVSPAQNERKVPARTARIYAYRPES